MPDEQFEAKVVAAKAGAGNVATRNKSRARKTLICDPAPQLGGAIRCPTTLADLVITKTRNEKQSCPV